MKILVALDGSEAAFNALASACGLAAKMHSYVMAFYVNKGQEYTAEEMQWLPLKEKVSNELESLGHDIIRKACGIGKDMGITVEGVISYGIPALEILRHVDAHGIIKLITMGHSSKGKGAQEFVESTTKNVVFGAKRPVFVTSSRVNARGILVAVDDSESSRKAVLFGGDIAKSVGAEVALISVVPDAEAIIGEYRKIAEVMNIEKHIDDSEKIFTEMSGRAISAARDILNSMGIRASSIIKKGNPSSEILSEAANYDLVIVGIKQKPSQKKPSRIAGRLLDSRSVSAIFVQ